MGLLDDAIGRLRDVLARRRGHRPLAALGRRADHRRRGRPGRGDRDRAARTGAGRPHRGGQRVASHRHLGRAQLRRARHLHGQDRRRRLGRHLGRRLPYVDGPAEHPHGHRPPGRARRRHRTRHPGRRDDQGPRPAPSRGRHAARQPRAVVGRPVAVGARRLPPGRGRGRRPCHPRGDRRLRRRPRRDPRGPQRHPVRDGRHRPPRPPARGHQPGLARQRLGGRGRAALRLRARGLRRRRSTS